MLKKESADEQAKNKRKRPVADNLPDPVPIQPAKPAQSGKSTTKRDDNASAFAIKPPGDTQELDGDLMNEQLDGLKRTLEADAFASKEPSPPSEQNPFGNSPPTVEMERPDRRD